MGNITKKTIIKIKKKNFKYDIFASVGPCISSKNYEVDFNFYKKFLAKTKKNKKYFKFRWQVEKFLEDGPLKNCWLTTVVSQPIPMGSST